MGIWFAVLLASYTIQHFKRYHKMYVDIEFDIQHFPKMSKYVQCIPQEGLEASCGISSITGGAKKPYRSFAMLRLSYLPLGQVVGQRACEQKVCELKILGQAMVCKAGKVTCASKLKAGLTNGSQVLPICYMVSTWLAPWVRENFSLPSGPTLMCRAGNLCLSTESIRGPRRLRYMDVLSYMGGAQKVLAFKRFLFSERAIGFSGGGRGKIETDLFGDLFGFSCRDLAGGSRDGRGWWFSVRICSEIESENERRFFVNSRASLCHARRRRKATRKLLRLILGQSIVVRPDQLGSRWFK